MRRRATRRLAGAVIAAGGLVLLGWLSLRGAGRSPSEDALLEGARPRGAPKASIAAPRPAKSEPQNAARGSEKEASAPDDLAGVDPKELWEKRLARARETLDTYAASTRYPPGSRPLREQPDQDKPHNPHRVKLPLARADHKLTDAHVTLAQDRYFVAADERVTLSLECETSDGPATCEVLSSVAGAGSSSQRGAPGAPPSASARRSIVAFSSGAQGGPMTAVFAPAEQGFEGYYGPIHIGIELRVEGETGGAGFDIQYTPSPPATFTGAAREVIEDGSLSLYVGLDASKAGRYVLQARVDDAKGRGLALLSFNDELPAGRVEAKLVLFGKLILDEGAEAPFRLRDLEGFLLKEDTFPDREIIPGIDGPVLTTRTYARGEFSDKEWQSEERERHLTEFKKDVEEAERAAQRESK